MTEVHGRPCRHCFSYLEPRQQLQDVSFSEFVQVILVWMGRLNPRVSRRELMYKLSAVFAAAATGPLFDVFDPDEQQHVMRVIQDPSGFDEPTLRYCEDMVNSTFAVMRRRGAPGLSWS